MESRKMLQMNLFAGHPLEKRMAVHSSILVWRIP